MEHLFKRYFWVIPLLVAVASAILAAKGTNHWIEGRFLLDASKKAARAPKAKKPDAPKTTPSKDPAAILSRDLFCSTCEPVEPVATSPTAVASDDGRAPTTTLPLNLLATAVAMNPRYSAATIANTASNRSGMYRIDDVIPEAGPVTRIAPRFIEFKNNQANRVERIDILGTAPPAPRPAVAVAPASQPAAPTEGDLTAEIEKGVKKVDDTHYEIDRGLVDKILADPTTVSKGARIVPSVKDGKANGFKVYAIRPNSPYAKIGLQNGDTIRSINGFEMTSPDKALEVYTKVKSASSLSIVVTRRGSDVTMEYTIK
jgi:general secretion pathway protein C